MPKELERVRTGDGLELVLHRWEPDGATEALCLLVHGYAEHAGRYGTLARALNERGVAVWAPDLRGHGLSGGARADVSVFARFVDDLRRVADLAHERRAELPKVLFGHSMGGTVALRYALERPDALRALALSAPYLRPANDPPRWMRDLVARLARIAPNLPVQPLAASLVSRDRSFVEAYRTDPLVYHGWVKARMAHELVSAGPPLLARAGAVELPTYIVHGGADGLAATDASRELASRIGAEDVTLRVLDGVFHESLNHEGGDELAAEIAQWLAQHARA